MKDNIEKSASRSKEKVGLSGALIIPFVLSGFVLGLFLDLLHFPTSLHRDCFIWGFLTGFFFYIPIAIAFLFSIAYFLTLLRISRRWFKVLVVLVSIPIANQCMILTYGGLALRCDPGSEFGMAIVFGIPVATIVGIIYAALIISSEKVPSEQEVFSTKKLVYIACNFLLLLVFVIICFPGLEMRPKITGIVVDSGTLKPVRTAWIKAYLILPRSSIPIEPPHTRTDVNGRFEIPMKTSWLSFPSFNLWKKRESITISADTLDDKVGSFHLDDYDWKVKVNVVIPVKPKEEGLSNEKEYFSYLRSLTDYCYFGRYEEKATKRTGGCDDWEMDFTIMKFEKYVEKYQNDKKSGYYNALESLASLYEKKGNYEKAIENYKKRIAFIDKNGYSGGLWAMDKKGAQYHITRLQALASKSNQ